MRALRLIGTFLRRTLAAIFLIAPVWGLAYAYVTYAPKSYATEIFLILPGEGSNTSLNLDSLGQASTSATSPWSSNRLSPVESYRKLLMTETVHRRAAAARQMDPDSFPRPKIKLIDQTNFITVRMKGKSPDGARANAQALLDAFNAELDRLRGTFAEERERPNRAAIDEYRADLDAARKALVDFQSRTGLASADQFGDRIALVERTAKRVRDVEAELERQAGQVRTLQQVLGANPAQAALALKLRADPIFQALLEDMTLAKIEFERARTQYGERHPKYLESRRNYESITAAMIGRGKILTGTDESGFRALADLATHGQRELMLSQMVELAATRDGLLAELGTLRAQHLESQGDVRRLAGPAGTLDQLVRQHQVAQAVFTSALAKADTTKADQFAAYPLAQVVERPLANEEAISPSPKIAAIAAIGATIFILMGLMLIWMRGPILRWIGRAFAHPSADIAVAVAQAPPVPMPAPVIVRAPIPEAVPEPEPAPEPRPAVDPMVMRSPPRRPKLSPAPEQEPLPDEPPMPMAMSLDDEPLIEIPHQVPHRGSMDQRIGGVMSVRLKPSDGHDAA